MRSLFLISAWLWSGSAFSAVSDRVAAVVNDEVIALSEVYDLGGDFIRQRCPASDLTCERQAELEILDSLIMQVLIRQELADLGLSVTGADVDRAIDQIRQDHNIGDIAAFRAEIERSGLRWDAYRDQLTDQLRQMNFSESILRPRVTTSDDELRDLYNRSVRGIDAPKNRIIEGLSVAITDTVDESTAITTAHDIIGKVTAGEHTWPEAVALYHSGFIASEDGSMGTFSQGELSPLLDTAVFEADVGGFTTPVNLGSAVMVIRIMDERSPDAKSFEESRMALSDALYESKVEREMERWFEIAKRKSSVQIKLDAE